MGGTRADFYLGRGPSATWLGSINWDGHPETIMGRRKARHEPNKLARSKTAEQFVRRLHKRMGDRDDFVQPPKPWPWPWHDSRTTDWAYAFDEGRVWILTCRDDGPHFWAPIDEELCWRAQPDDDEGPIVITAQWLQAVVEEHGRQTQASSPLVPWFGPSQKSEDT